MIKLYTSLALVDGCIASHILSALQKNIDYPLVDSISVITESPIQLVREYHDTFDSPKINLVQVNCRPSFEKIVGVVNQDYLEGDGSYVSCILNSDISFWSLDDIRRVAGSLRELNHEGRKVAFCLTRYELSGDGCEQVLVTDTGLPNAISADAWFFLGEIKLERECYYSLGQIFCDKFFNHDLIASGYKLFNPCLDIITVHHEDDVKSFEYYKELVDNSSSQDDLKKHWRNSVDGSVGYYGVSHVSVESVLAGYTPSPMIINDRKKKFYLFVSFSISENEFFKNFISLLVDYISSINFDLYLLVESDGEHLMLLKYLSKLKATNCYVIKASDIRNTFSSFVGGATAGASNIFCINNFTKIDKKIFDKFSMIFSVLDLSDMSDSGESRRLKLMLSNATHLIENGFKGGDHEVEHVFVVTKYGGMLRTYLSKLFFEDSDSIVIWVDSLSKSLLDRIKSLYVQIKRGSV